MSTLPFFLVRVSLMISESTIDAVSRISWLLSITITDNIFRKLVFKIAQMTVLYFDQVLDVLLTQLVLAHLLMLIKRLYWHKLVTERALALADVLLVNLRHLRVIV